MSPSATSRNIHPFTLIVTVLLLRWSAESAGARFKPEFQPTHRAARANDADHLYMAFLCHDYPAEIRATKCQSDKFFEDDAVCLLIDTYCEASWACELFINPCGVRKENLRSSNAGVDHGFDLIWQSAAIIADSGYLVELAVPFSSMRFSRHKPERPLRYQSWRP